MMHFALQKKLHTAQGEMLLNIDCEVADGEIISLYGSSGAGKTSVLRMLAGFMQPDDGFININNDVWFNKSKRINLTPQQRKIGFVFQDYALFPNMNVLENIAFASSKNEPGNIVDELLELTGLSLLSNRKIQTLSGGQKQRVALARAIAAKPAVLLLDEPLSAIDNNMRAQLQTTLLALHKRYALTTILVSHDMDEVVRLADKIIHLEHGSMQQYTTPSAFFLNNNQPSALTGTIVLVEVDCVVVLINSSVMQLQSKDRNVKFTAGEKVEIVYNNNVAVMRKL